MATFKKRGYKKSLKSQYISASSVFDGKFDESRFKNKYVLIGASAQGLFDLVKTPLIEFKNNENTNI